MSIKQIFINPLSAKFIKWSNTLKQIVGKLPTICLSVFDHFSGLALKGLKTNIIPLFRCFFQCKKASEKIGNIFFSKKCFLFT